MSWTSWAVGLLCPLLACSVLTTGGVPRYQLAQDTAMSATPPPLALQGSLSSATQASFLTAIDMTDPQTGFDAGYWHNRFSVWTTDDGGSRWVRHAVPWVPKYDPNQGSPAPTVLFVSTKMGWIAWIAKVGQVNRLTVLRTTDGGRTWTRHMQEVLPVANYVQQISFSSDQNGWIRTFSGGAMNQGDTSIFGTTNRGQSWKLMSSTGGYVPNKKATPHALPEFDVPMPMVFTNANEGWIATGNFMLTQKSIAMLYHSTTAGRTWYPIRLPVPRPFQRKFFATVGYQPVFSGESGTIPFEFMGRPNALVSYHTTNGGKAWTAGTTVSLGNQLPLVSCFLNPNIGWIVGSTGTDLVRTHNAGQSWSSVPVTGALASMLYDGYSVQQLNMVTPEVGWMMVENVNGISSAVSTRVLKTINGGLTWK